jgi:hypothetical protein
MTAWADHGPEGNGEPLPRRLRRRVLVRADSRRRDP